MDPVVAATCRESGANSALIGLAAMVFYFIMAGFIYLDVTFPRNEIFFHFYIVSFGVGFIFRVISIGYYVIDLNNWQKEYNSAV